MELINAILLLQYANILHKKIVQTQVIELYNTVLQYQWNCNL